MQNPPSLTREQARELDRIAICEYGIDGLILMENAGRWCARAAARMLGQVDGARVAVLCGKGNNGGDGFVIARHLSNWGAEPQVVLLAGIDQVLAANSDASANLRIVLNMELPVLAATTPQDAAGAVRERADSALIVDALLGTGAQGEVREPFLSAVRAVNDCACPVLAVDVPSGLDCDTGRPLGEAVRANRTVTFVAPKVGFAAAGAAQYTGQVEVAEIGIPRSVLAKAKTRQGQPRRTRRARRKAGDGFDELSNRVIGCAIAVHSALGPGLLESAYQQCLAHELRRRGIPFRMEWPVPVEYAGMKLACGYRADFLIDDTLLVEIKAVRAILDIHRAQVLTYMKLARASVALLINFNAPLLKDGIKRFVL